MAMAMAMANGEVMKRRKLKNSDDDGQIKAVDQIWDLPEQILHHIMSFLPATDVNKTIILSKTFRSVWSSYPIIDFDDDLLQKRSGLYGSPIERINKFLNFLHVCLQFREPNSRIQKLRLRVTLSDAVQWDNRIDRWIGFAVDHNVEELDLDIKNKDHLFYKLPQAVFSSKSITSLKLKGFRLEPRDLILSCPLIQDLSLRCCDGLKYFTASSARLRTIKLDNCYGLRRIEIEALYLQSFLYGGGLGKPCEINIAACKFLRNLTLERANITDEWFEDHVAKFLLLKMLKLSFCKMLKNIKVSGTKLETLELDHCKGLQKIEITALNLQSFLYKGHSRPCEINIAACKLLKDLRLVNANITDSWFEDHVSPLLLENLKLDGCRKLERIKISNKQLKSFHLLACNKLKEAEIDAPNLQSFQYNGGSRPCQINVDSCKLLKDLMLVNAKVTDRWFEDHVSRLLLLENLKLDSCNMLERIKISNQQLKSFHLLGCNKLVEAEIDTPTLISLSYGDLKLSLHPLMTFIISSSLVNAKLSLGETSLTTKYFVDLRDLLRFFGHCKILTLLCESDEVLIFPDELRDDLLPPLYDLKHLKIEVSSKSINYARLVSSLLWLAPRTETISFVSGNIEKSIKLKYEKMVAKQEESDCCKSRPIKCWRHHLKQVTMQNFENVDDKKGLLEFFSTNAKMLDTIYDNSRVYRIAGGKYSEQR
ncbi:hypothetical protein L1049_016008 [Liquidambar formosana]|uniref:F-box domain-containing protein n=1 Tax=Liquidambar formosana TaxID=63359 RepID=A0AAP0R3E9_LIQFO